MLKHNARLSEERGVIFAFDRSLMLTIRGQDYKKDVRANVMANSNNAGRGKRSGLKTDRREA